MAGRTDFRPGYCFLYCGGEYPDFISGNIDLYEANALIPVDEYWDEYPNLRSYFTDSQWELLKQEDGHIYWIPSLGIKKSIRRYSA